MSTYAPTYNEKHNLGDVAEDYWRRINHVPDVSAWPNTFEHHTEVDEWRGTHASTNAGGLRLVSEALWRLSGALNRAQASAYGIVENAINADAGAYEEATDGIDAWWKHEGMTLDAVLSVLIDVASEKARGMAIAPAHGPTASNRLEES